MTKLRMKKFYVQLKELSDGSAVFDVYFFDAYTQQRALVADWCLSQDEAQTLADELNLVLSTNWAQISGGG